MSPGLCNGDMESPYNVESIGVVHSEQRRRSSNIVDSLFTELKSIACNGSPHCSENGEITWKGFC